MKPLLTIFILFFAGICGKNIPGANYLSGFDPIKSKFLSPLFNFTTNRNISSNVKEGAFVPDQIAERTDSSGTFELYAETYTRSTEMTAMKDMKISADAKWKIFFGSLNAEKLKNSKYFAEHDVNIQRVHASINKYDLELQASPLNDNAKRQFNLMYNFVSIFNITGTDVDCPPAMQVVNFLIDNFYRIYGTQHVWRATFGGIIALDYVLQTDIANQMTKEQLKAHASAGFSAIFKVGLDFNAEKTTEAKFKQAKKNQFVRNCGGTPWYSNMTIKIWEDSLVDSPCTIEYDIRPNSDLLDESIIENNDDFLTKNTYINALRALMIQRADVYYKHNIYGGCTEPASANYLWYSNFDDGSCEKEDNHQPHGGFWIWSDCAGFNVVNHDTQGMSCRAPFTDSVLIDGAFIESGSYTERICQTHHHWFHKKVVCHDVQKSWSKTCHETVHQCTYYNSSAISRGFYVGGMYTPYVDNIVTASKSCPPGFHDRIIFYYDQRGYGIHICQLGHDEVAVYPEGAIKFGGIFNCRMPHPFTKDFRCPAGYMKHSLGSIQACDWWYCIHISDMKHRVLYYPPGYGTEYPDFPFGMIKKRSDIIDALTIRNPIIDTNEIEKHKESEKHEKHGLTALEIFGIVAGSIFATLVITVGVVFLYFSVRKPKENYETLN